MWQPWIGTNFDRRRILILGESCYNWEDDYGAEQQCQPDHPVRAIEWMRADPLDGARTLRKITRAICGSPSPIPTEASARWQDFSYTNYVPISVGLGRKQRPSEAAWKLADDEWPVLLASIRPSVVLALGKTMWLNYMPATQEIITPLIEGYAYGSGQMAMCFAVPHPAYGPAWNVYAGWIAALERYADDGDVEMAKVAFASADKKNGVS